MPLLVPPVQKQAKKANMARMNDPREAACGGAEGEGKNSQAKGSDQDGTSESARQRRCTPKGQLIVSGISQVTTEAEGPKGSFCPFFCAKTAASRRKGASAPIGLRPLPPEGEASLPCGADRAKHFFCNTPIPEWDPIGVFILCRFPQPT